jgi:serine/threonine protein phosphatase PrpC
MSGGAVSGTVSGNLVKALKKKFDTGHFSSPDETKLIRKQKAAANHQPLVKNHQH